MKDLNKCYLILLVVVSLSIKWIISLNEFGFNLNILSLFNLKDTQYFPIIYSLSEFNISPSYLEEIKPDKILGFPFLGLFIHALFYKFIGIYAFIFFEYIFQIIFLLVIYKLFIKVFNDKNKSFYFILFLFLIYSFLSISHNYQQYIPTRNLFYLFESNLGTRFPRPLISGVLIFLMIYYLIDFNEQLSKNFNKSYIIKISILSGLLLNTFFYYFTIFLLLILVTTLKNINKDLDFKILVKRFFLFVFIFSIFATPFILQQIFLEPDYAIRIGLINLDSNQKLFLLKYFFKKFMSIKFSLVIFILVILFSILNMNKKNKKINFFFFFVLASMISPIIFILFSKSIISIYHYADIIVFNVIFYLLICSFIFLYVLIEKKFYFKFISHKTLPIFLILIILVFRVNYEKNIIFQKKDIINESIKVERFLLENKIEKTSLKLFTNDRITTNIWLLNKNKNILLTDGFTNSLPNFKIEYILINCLKYLGFSEQNLRDFISLGKSETRNHFFIRLFIYRYQANSLYTFSELNNYSEDVVNKIMNSSPLRAQNQIIPEDEKKRLIDLFNNHKVNNDLNPDYLIIDFSKISNNFKVRNKAYIEIFSTENYKIYRRN